MGEYELWIVCKFFYTQVNHGSSKLSRYLQSWSLGWLSVLLLACRGNIENMVCSWCIRYSILG